MIHDFYGLDRDAFSLSPDLDFLFLSQEHEEAVAHLVYGLEQNEDIILIVGDIGTGKTLAIHRVISQLSNTFVPVLVNVTTLDFGQLLRLILLKLEADPGPETDLSTLINHFEVTLVHHRDRAKKVLIIVDEAQNLPLDVLESIRLLMNLAQPGGQALQLVISGQLGLREKISLPRLRQLRQRIRVDYQFGFLSEAEVAEYVRHRLRTAGGEDSLFDKGALAACYELSQGVPRVVNYVASKALLAGFVDGAKRISRRHFADISSSELLEAAPEEEMDVVAAHSPIEVVAPSIELVRPDQATVSTVPPEKSKTVLAPATYAHRRHCKGGVWTWIVVVALVGVVAGFFFNSPYWSGITSITRVMKPESTVKPLPVNHIVAVGGSDSIISLVEESSTGSEVVEQVEPKPSQDPVFATKVDMVAISETTAAVPTKKIAANQAASGVPGQFLVHVASFLAPDRGETFSDNLRGRGVKSFVHSVTLAGGKVWYRVYVGPFDSRQSAIAAARDMKEKGWVSFSRITTP